MCKRGKNIIFIDIDPWKSGAIEVLAHDGPSVVACPVFSSNGTKQYSKRGIAEVHHSKSNAGGCSGAES